jgi:hypothetical protein
MSTKNHMPHEKILFDHARSIESKVSPKKNEEIDSESLDLRIKLGI